MKVFHLLDDQPFTLPRKEAKEKELRKPSFENLISPNRSKLLSCDKNENENLHHREKSEAFNQIDFKVTEPSVPEKSSLNSNASIVKTLYVGNLNKNVTEQDLIELFGLRTTNYLRNTCRVKLILCSKTNNSRGFAFVNGPEHVLNELVKLKGIEFQEKKLVIDEPKKKPSTPSLTPLRKIPVEVSQKYPRQTASNRTPVVPGHKNFSEATKLKSTNSYNTLIFSDSIPKGIRMYQFNRALRNRRAKVLNFQGASSNEILHYIDVHLKEKLIDTVIIHVGVHDLLNGNSQLKVNELIENIRKITEKCVSFGVKKIYVSGLVFTRRVNLPTLERVHALLSRFCGDNGFVYIDNRNITGDCLYQDSLHLLNTGKNILERNFIFVLNECFLE